jgi:hypothetical protein
MNEYLNESRFHSRPIQDLSSRVLSRVNTGKVPKPTYVPGTIGPEIRTYPYTLPVIQYRAYPLPG